MVALMNVGMSMKTIPPMKNENARFLQVNHPNLAHLFRKYVPPGMYTSVAVTTPGEYSPPRIVAEMCMKALVNIHIAADIPVQRYFVWSRKYM